MSQAFVGISERLQQPLPAARSKRGGTAACSPPWFDAVCELRKLTDASTPTAMLSIITDTFKAIYRAIESPASARVVGADDLMPIMIYVAIKAQVQVRSHLSHASHHLVDRFPQVPGFPCVFKSYLYPSRFRFKVPCVWTHVSGLSSGSRGATLVRREALQPDDRLQRNGVHFQIPTGVVASDMLGRLLDGF